MKRVFIISFLALSLAACKRDHSVDIKIESPTNRSYPNGQLIPVRINFSSDGEIEDIEVKIKNKSNNDEVVFEEKRHLHMKSYTMNGEYVPNVSSESRMKLEAKVKDHDKKEIAKAEVEFTVTP